MGKLFKLTIDAHAKVNLSLSVEGATEEKMHLLDFVGLTIPLHDEVAVSVRSDKDITIKYHDGRSYECDNAVKAAQAVMQKYDTLGVDIEIVKCIPEGAGFGGSTADGVAVIKCMQTLFDIGELNNEWLLSLGSDFPFMYNGGACRVRGVGELVTPVRLPKINGVAVYKKGLSVSTKEVFHRYDKLGGRVGNIDEFLAEGLTSPFNSLEAAACDICPEIMTLGDKLRDLGFPNVVMTGSGSACVGYFVGAELGEKTKKDLALAFGPDVYEIN